MSPLTFVRVVLCTAALVGVFPHAPALAKKQAPFSLQSGPAEVRVMPCSEGEGYELHYYLRGRLRARSGRDGDYITAIVPSCTAVYKIAITPAALDYLIRHFSLLLVRCCLLPYYTYHRL